MPVDVAVQPGDRSAGGQDQILIRELLLNVSGSGSDPVGDRLRLAGGRPLREMLVQVGGDGVGAGGLAQGAGVLNLGPPRAVRTDVPIHPLVLAKGAQLVAVVAQAYGAGGGIERRAREDSGEDVGSN